MSFRAVLIGMLSAMLLAGVAYVNDGILRLNRLVSNHLPITVFGGLISMIVGASHFGLTAKTPPAYHIFAP